MRIVIFSERLQPPFDEGIKHTAWQLIRSLREEHRVLALTAFSRGWPDEGIEPVTANKLLWGRDLRRRLGDFRPDLLLYIPTACATWPSFWRARTLRAHARGARTALISLQPRSYGPLARLLIPRLRPDAVLVTGDASRRALGHVGCPAKVMPPGVDVQRFAPVPVAVKRAMRRRYGLADHRYVVLHVGHINAKRNVLRLTRLQEDGYQVVVIGSTSTPQDAAIAEALRQAGVRVVTDYVPNVEVFYQMADVYVFPAVGDTAAVEVPLSVLEALACDLPVVSTPFGNLPALFPAGDGVIYIESVAAMSDAVIEMVRGAAHTTRSRILPYAWEQTARRVLELSR